jgi:hypothetical protein
MSVSDREYDKLAQKAHLLGGAIVIWGSILFFGRESIPFAWLAVLLLSGIKEFWWDETFETAEIRGSSLKDFAFYLLGAMLAISIYWWVKE